MHRMLLVLLPAAIIALTYPAHATTCINTEDEKPGLISSFELPPPAANSKQSLKELQREEKRLLRFEKRIVQFQQRMTARQESRIGGIGDSTDRWFWFWIIGWGAGLLLTIISGGTLTTGVLGIFWMLSFAFGSVSLILWLLKRFQ